MYISHLDIVGVEKQLFKSVQVRQILWYHVDVVTRQVQYDHGREVVDLVARERQDLVAMVNIIVLRYLHIYLYLYIYIHIYVVYFYLVIHIFLPSKLELVSKYIGKIGIQKLRYIML